MKFNAIFIYRSINNSSPSFFFFFLGEKEKVVSFKLRHIILDKKNMISLSLYIYVKSQSQTESKLSIELKVSNGFLSFESFHNLFVSSLYTCTPMDYFLPNVMIAPMCYSVLLPNYIHTDFSTEKTIPYFSRIHIFHYHNFHEYHSR